MDRQMRNGQMDGLIYVWLVGCFFDCLVGRLVLWLGSWMAESWMGGWKYALMDRWIDRLMDGKMD